MNTIRTLGAMAAVAVTACGHYAEAQTVQLPTNRQFSVTGSILVPDYGSTFAGKNAYLVQPYGPRRSQALGTGASNGNVSASAYVHDLDALDRRIRGIDNDPALAIPANRNPMLANSPAPVASIYGQPLPDETLELTQGRRMRLNEFDGGYMMMLSHPQLRQQLLPVETPSSPVTVQANGG